MGEADIQHGSMPDGTERAAKYQVGIQLHTITIGSTPSPPSLTLLAR